MAEKSFAGLLKGRFMNEAVNIYLVLMFTVFPLVFTNGYFRIRHDKYYTYVVLSAAPAIAALFTVVYGLLNRDRLHELNKKPLNITDISFIGLVLVYIFSTCVSDYPLSCISGEIGRNMGLIFIITSFIVYIIISRFLSLREYVFYFAAGGCAVVYILCVLNFFYVDPLRMFVNLDSETIMDFTSTIGNKNIMSAFCCLSLPLFFTLYIVSEKRALRNVSLVMCGLGFSAMVCADSDSGFMGLALALAAVLIYCGFRAFRLRRFFTAAAVMLICAKVIGLLSAVIKYKDLGAVEKFFVFDNISYLLIGASVLIVLIMLIIEKRYNVDKLPKAVSGALAAVVIISFGIVIWLFIKYSVIDTQTKLGTVMSYFRFDEGWGTHRGFFWIKAVEIFKNSGLKNMLFGSGPDTFYYAFSPYFNELSTRFGDSSTNCAHNELLNYLITVGITGVVMYLLLVVSAVIKALKGLKNNALGLVFVIPVLCYFFQSTVNIATPIVTPIMFIYLGILRALDGGGEEAVKIFHTHR